MNDFFKYANKYLYLLQNYFMRKITFIVFVCLVDVAIAQNENKVVEDFIPGTIISGIVSDASTGEPIGNALIVETVMNDTAAYYYTRTDRDGRFSYPLFGTGHVLKVIANRREYKRVKIPLENKTTFEIKLEKDPDGDGGDGVMYTIGPFDLRDSNTPEGREKRRSGSNISVVKPGSLRDDGEGLIPLGDY